MPDLPQTKVHNQNRYLPTERTISTIPRAVNSTYGGVPEPKPADDGYDALSKWEYPSPQQFYNALVRKGWNTPEEHVEAMVLIHNRLNEDAWTEVLNWETRFGGGSAEAAKLELAEFAGIHGHVSHKAWIYQCLRRYCPSYFAFAPPFDRHDWIVRRPLTGRRIRYVIDYYSSRKTVLHEPEFHLDVRPASDNVRNICMKI
ncbi:cytochrome c and c1 heme-lyase, partial [Crucibulum laeve]